MSRIPQSFIDELLDRIDLVEVVDHRVKLKKSGKNYSACCPFHDEKTPSFTVSPDKQFYYCFGCGASGNAVGFIMDYERISFPEAVENLAHNAGLEIPREAPSPAQSKEEKRRKRLYALLEQCNDFYLEQLRQHPGRKTAINYLKQRGLNGQIARDYDVGYAPPGWDNLLKALGTNEQIQSDLLTAGMLIASEQADRRYDRFRQRIMFPIRDSRGRVIGFGGRVLDSSKPKYLNSPETPVFHKGRELYGLYEANNAYRQLPRLLVVEGYMDVVALAQFGIRYGVATLGTACGEEHLVRAFRHTSEVVFCFDGDAAGRRAATRALEAALPVMDDGRQVKFLFLPEGEDPDSLVRQVGPEKFEQMINLAVPLEDYLFDAAAEGINIRTMEGRAHLSKRAAPLLARLPKGVFRELMFDALAERAGLSRATLEELIETPEPLPSQAVHETSPPEAPSFPEAEYLPSSEGPPPTDIPPEAYADEDSHADTSDPAPSASHQPQSVNVPSRYLLPPVQKALALLLSHPHLASETAPASEWLQQDDLNLRRLGRLLDLLQQRPHYQLPQVMGHWRAHYDAEETLYLATIASHDMLRAAGQNYDPATALQDCLSKLRQQQQDQQRLAALAQLKSPAARQLSREQLQALMEQALAGKNPP